MKALAIHEVCHAGVTHRGEIVIEVRASRGIKVAISTVATVVVLFWFHIFVVDIFIVLTVPPSRVIRADSEKVEATVSMKLTPPVTETCPHAHSVSAATVAFARRGWASLVV